MSFENGLRQSVVSALAYFDLADYPLTKEELFSFLWQPPTISYSDFLIALSALDPTLTLPLKREVIAATPLFKEGLGEVNTKFGYYFLSGREKIVESRRRKLLISEQKLKIARRAVRIIRSVPFLRAVFVCNSTGAEQANDDSDIDFFIITEKNRIWITRLLVTFLLALFGLRRARKRIKNKICLSFYVTVENLDLAKWRVAEDDIHFAYWLNQMLPIFDPDNYYARFLQANHWTKIYLPNINLSSRAKSQCHCGLPPLLGEGQGVGYLFEGCCLPHTPPSIPPLKREGTIGRVWKKAWEKMWEGGYGDMIDSQAKKIQLYKMRFSGKPIDRGEDKGVVISDGVLKFHEKDTRIEYREKWKSKILNFKF